MIAASSHANVSGIGEKQALGGSGQPASDTGEWAWLVQEASSPASIGPPSSVSENSHPHPSFFYPYWVVAKLELVIGADAGCLRYLRMEVGSHDELSGSARLDNTLQADSLCCIRHHAWESKRGVRSTIPPWQFSK